MCDVDHSPVAVLADVSNRIPRSRTDARGVTAISGSPRADRSCLPAPASTAWQNLWVRGKRVEVLRLGAGAPLVFLHGWGMNPRPYLSALRALAARDHQIHAPSLPGFGNSWARPPWQQTVSGVADHMAATLDRLALGPVPLIGHSFGGGVALRLAAVRPDLVASLTLFGPVGGAARGIAPMPTMLCETAAEITPQLAADWMRFCSSALFRRPIAVAASGRSARTADLVTEARMVCDAGIPLRLVLAARDQVVRPGDLPTCAPEVSVVTVPGRHSWLLDDPHGFASLADPCEPEVARTA